MAYSLALVTIPFDMRILDGSASLIVIFNSIFEFRVSGLVRTSIILLPMGEQIFEMYDFTSTQWIITTVLCLVPDI